MVDERKVYGILLLFEKCYGNFLSDKLFCKIFSTSDVFDGHVVLVEFNTWFELK